MARSPAGEVTIRPATDADLDALVEVMWQVAAEGRWLGTEVPFDRSARRQRFAEGLAADHVTTLVADAAPAPTGPAPTGPALPAGVVGLIGVTVAPYGVADIGMAVLEPWRGRGVGRRLLDAALAWATGAGAHKMALEVWPDNTAAIGLYTAAGFVEEGRKRRHYRRRNGELWDALLMGRPLP